MRPGFGLGGETRAADDEGEGELTGASGWLGRVIGRLPGLGQDTARTSRIIMYSQPEVWLICFARRLAAESANCVIVECTAPATLASIDRTLPSERHPRHLRRIVSISLGAGTAAEPGALPVGDRDERQGYLSGYTTDNSLPSTSTTGIGHGSRSRT